MPNRDYHMLQAGLLVRLAETTTDAAVAPRLMAMAADHIALAERYAIRSSLGAGRLEQQRSWSKDEI